MKIYNIYYEILYKKNLHIPFPSVLQLHLKDENERLRLRMDSMQQKFGNLAHTKTDLSQELLITEEEKLKVNSVELIQMLYIEIYEGKKRHSTAQTFICVF